MSLNDIHTFRRVFLIIKELDVHQPARMMKLPPKVEAIVEANRPGTVRVIAEETEFIIQTIKSMLVEDLGN